MADRGVYSALAPGKSEEAPLKPVPKPSLLRRTRNHPVRTALIVGAVVVCILALALGLVFGLRARNSGSNSVSSSGVANLDVSPPNNGFPSILEAFVSYAIEFYYLPDFAGTPSSPGTFSDNLLNNIGNISGTKPYIRVGGNSADLAIYNESLENATQATFTSNYKGYKNFESVQIGRSFFDSFKTWPDVKFIYNLNLKNASSSAAGWSSLKATIPLACTALNSNLLAWEYGNEPDYYPRPRSSWNTSSYVTSWSSGIRAVQSALHESCPSLSTPSSFSLVGPSLAEPTNLPPVSIFSGGYNANGSLRQYTLHNYMGDCSLQACSLQSTLMNHTAVTASLASVASQITPMNHGPLINPSNASTLLPFVLDETNSLLSLALGPPRLGGVFGAALWGVDYLLYAAAIGISRVHVQQGTGFGYNSWQPVSVGSSGVLTAPPYYGNVMVAAMVGDVRRDGTRIVNVQIPASDGLESAYAAYVNGSTLARVAVVNMHAYNATGAGGATGNGGERGRRTYTFGFPAGMSVEGGLSVRVQRLVAPGSDVTANVTWDGWSYDYELAEGKPVKVGPETVETVTVSGGQVSVSLNDSSAAILNFVSS